MKWFFFVGWDLRHQVLRPLLAYCTASDDKWGWLWSNWWNKNWQGKPKYSEKTYPSAILFTTNPTWPDPCANTGRRGGKSVTNRLSYGAAMKWFYLWFNKWTLMSSLAKTYFIFDCHLHSIPYSTIPGQVSVPNTDLHYLWRIVCQIWSNQNFQANLIHMKPG
jgi:hypothetical protein